MDRESGPLVVLYVTAAVALGIAVAIAILASMSRSMTGMMGGMMGGPPGTAAGVWDIILLAAAIGIAVVALALAFSLGRAPRTPAPPVLLPAPVVPREEGAATPSAGEARVQREQEAVFVRALSEDERNLYMRIREQGGAALQRDLVASGAFSKAKVTRLLDKLERKGLVVRERYGATNRVRLTWKRPPTS